MSETKTLLSKCLCVLISGKAGVGKTVSANFAVEYLKSLGYNESHKVSFADSLKDMAKSCLGWNGEKDVAGRQLLQDLGGVGRNYNKNIWVKNTIENVVNLTGVFLEAIVIDDWRFPNEIDYIKENEPMLQVVSIRIESPDREILKGTPQYNDVSETDLPSVSVENEIGLTYFLTNHPYYNYVIANFSSLEELEETIKFIITKELNKIVFN